VQPPNTTIKEDERWRSTHTLRARRTFVASAAADVVSLLAARAGAQEPPSPLSPPTADARRVPADSLPELAHLAGGWTAGSVGARARKTSFELAAKEASLHAADSSIESSNIQLRSAEEAYRACRELFRYGKWTSVELADAEGDLFRARLSARSAGIDQRLARVRIEHATCRYVTRGGT